MSANPPTPPDARAAHPVLKSRRSYAEQIAGRCVHFSGISEKSCRAGVAYDSVQVMNDPPIEYVYDRSPTAIYREHRALPCLVSHNLGGATCAKCQFPTAEEVAAKEAESKRSVEMITNARRAIVLHIEATGKQADAIGCPNCGGRLSYARASSNGHIHARCSNERCVAWME